MVEGRRKSGRFRRISTKLPGGKTVTHYKLYKPGKPTCAECGAILQGVPRGGKSEMKNMPKTMKRPERPYGGVLCSRCMRIKIVQKARQQ